MPVSVNLQGEMLRPVDSGVGAGDTAASPSKFFSQIWVEFRPI